MKLGPLPIGVFELAIILIVVLIIFGPKNLPKLGAAMGKAVKNLREGLGSKKKAAEAKKQASEPAQKAPAQPEIKEAEIEVIDKPEPGQKAKAASAEASEEA